VARTGPPARPGTTAAPSATAGAVRAAPDREAPDGRTADGTSADGTSADRRTPDRRTPDRRTPDGRTPDGRTPDGRTPDGRTPDRGTPDGKTTDRPGPDRSIGARAAPHRPTLDRGTPHLPATERPTPDRAAADRAASDRPAPNRATSDRATPDSATPGLPAPNHPAADPPIPSITIGLPSTAVPGSTADQAAAPTPVVPRLAGEDLFGRHVRSYAAEHSGQPITILQAGCTTAEDLGIDALRAAGARLTVSMVDEDSEVTRAAVARHHSMAGATLGDLRSVPLAPRAYDIVQCSLLLGRIDNAELVLDRLAASVKPGGLLLLRIRDRDSAAGFLDRALPELARRAIWRKRQPGEPGPHGAVYERIASGRGVQAYVLAHGLVIAERGALGGLGGGLPHDPYGYVTAQKLVALLSRGRLTPAHEDLLYVVRKPEDRFARLL